jgi:hypothetical protein
MADGTSLSGGIDAELLGRQHYRERGDRAGWNRRSDYGGRREPDGSDYRHRRLFRDVVATTPLAGTDLEHRSDCGPVQTATAADVENSGALDLADFMNRRLNGVYLNEMQANPFQPDVNFRGYTASPLLGTPEGISVYLDGVRQNQPFRRRGELGSDSQERISEVTLVPGSDPLFGLNTLGGALSVQTKDGVSNPGLDGTLTYGSSGRKAGAGELRRRQSDRVQLVSGRQSISTNRDGASIRLRTSGRDLPAGLAHDKTDIALTYVLRRQHSDRERAAGLSPARRQLFERLFHPRQHREPLALFQSHRPPHLQHALTFSGNAWYRHIRTEWDRRQSQYRFVR